MTPAGEAVPAVSLPDLLGARAAADPNRVALRVVGRVDLTLGAWDRRASEAAWGLVARGVAPGHRVALRFTNSGWADHAVALAAVLRVGATAVAVPAAVGPVELSRLLDDSSPTLLIGTAPSARASSTPVATLDELCSGQPRDPYPARPRDGAEAAVLRYCTGPLTPPAATLVSHAELMDPRSWLAPEHQQGLLVLHAFAAGTPAADRALIAALGMHVACVACLPLVTPAGVDRALADLRPAVLGLPAFLAMSLEGANGAAELVRSQVRHVLIDGALPGRYREQMAAAFPAATLHLMAAPSPQRTLPDDPHEPEGAHEAPAGLAGPDVAALVASVWQRVLGGEAAGGDDFFALGGTPFGAARALALLQDALGVVLDPRRFIELRTLGEWVAAAVGEQAAGRHRLAPLAPAQEGMLWHEQFVPGSFRMPPLVRRLRGPLDPAVLERALHDVVRRHPVLGSTFELAGLRPAQLAAPGGHPLELIDLAPLPSDERDERVAAVVQEAAASVADLVRGPLFRPRLVRLSDDDHVLVIALHHLVLDDWSLGLLRREISATYAAHLTGEASPLADPPIAFSDFCRRQRQRIAGPAGVAELDWWRRELAGAACRVELPIEDPALAAGSRQPPAEDVVVRLPSELTGALRSLARSHRATTFMTVLAGFAALVARYSGRDDVLLSTIVANRSRTELEELVGCFAKKVLVRADLAGDPTFTEVVGRVRKALLAAMSHQDLPFETVVQEVLGAEACAHGLAPQVNVLFQGLAAPRTRLALPGVTPSQLEVGPSLRGVPHFLAARSQQPAGQDPWGAGLTTGTFFGLSMAEADDHMVLAVRGTFHRPGVERLLAHLELLLQAVAAAPGRRLSELPATSDADRADLEHWNETAIPPNPHARLDRAFEVESRRDPHRPAVVSSAGVITMEEIDGRAAAIAGQLRVVGAGPRAVVGLLVDSAPDAVAALLGVWKAGAAFLAVDGGRAASLDGLARAGAAFAVVAEGTGLSVLAVPGAACAPTSDGPEGGDLACMWTAGPRDVARLAVSHQALLDLAAGLRALTGAGSGEAGGPLRAGAVAGAGGASFVRALLGLLAGHCLEALAEPPDLDPEGATGRLGDGRLDVLECSAAGVEGLVACGLREALLRRPAGAPEPVLLITAEGPPDSRIWRTLASLAASVHVMYAPPGCSLGATGGRVDSNAARPHVGRPLPNVTANVLDGHGRVVPPRVTGRLHLGSSSAPVGLGLRDTGQLARRLPDGSVELLGPVDDAVDLGGFLVRPSVMDAALAGAPGVREAAVVLRTDGAGQRRLVVYVVAEAEPPPSLVQLRLHLWREVPGYAWPAQLVVVPHLPRRPDGAVDSQALPPAPAEPGGGRAPATDEERLLASLWAASLGVDAVDVTANYWLDFSFLDIFARGLSAGVPADLEQLGRHRTLEALAAALAVAARPTPTHPVP